MPPSPTMSHLSLCRCFFNTQLRESLAHSGERTQKPSQTDGACSPRGDTAVTLNTTARKTRSRCWALTGGQRNVRVCQARAEQGVGTGGRAQTVLGGGHRTCKGPGLGAGDPREEASTPRGRRHTSTDVHAACAPGQHGARPPVLTSPPQRVLCVTGAVSTRHLSDEDTGALPPVRGPSPARRARRGRPSGRWPSGDVRGRTAAALSPTLHLSFPQTLTKSVPPGTRPNFNVSTFLPRTKATGNPSGRRRVTWGCRARAQLCFP